MQRLEVSCVVRHIYMYACVCVCVCVCVVRRQRVNVMYMWVSRRLHSYKRMYKLWICFNKISTFTSKIPGISKVFIITLGLLVYAGIFYLTIHIILHWDGFAPLSAALAAVLHSMRRGPCSLVPCIVAAIKILHANLKESVTNTVNWLSDTHHI